MDMRSLQTFSETAYQCLQKSPAQRPNMSHVVEKLEIVVQFQQGISNPEEFKEMVKCVLNKEELERLLSNGIIIDGGNKWFSLNKNGEHCEMISAECFHTSFVEPPHNYVPYHGKNISRFEVRNRRGLFGSFTARVTTQFLSPDITYKVNLVFMNVHKRVDHLGIKYRSAGETEYKILSVAHKRGDGWLTAELYQFINDTGNVDLEIEFHCPNAIEVEGIEFLPLNKHELLLEYEDVDLQTDTDSGQKLPSDYEDIIKWSKIFKSLSLDSSEDDNLQSLMFIQQLCTKSFSNKHIIRNADLIPMIVEMLKSTSRKVRCRSLQTLRVVVEDDNDNKDILADGDRVRTIVKFLSIKHSQEREEAVLLLYELSKSEALCEKIGSVNGAILILVGMTSSKSEFLLIVEKADKVLENLEKNVNNVRQMAENGRLGPLLTLLLEGSLEIKLSMASYIGELALSNDIKVFVARTVGSLLISLMNTGDTQSRETTLKALNQLSSCEASAKILVEQGILSPIIIDLFEDPDHLPLRLKEVSATILANIVTSDCDFNSIPVGPYHQTLVSEDIIHKLLRLMRNTGPTIEYTLVQVLIGLTNSPVTVIPVANAIKSSGAINSLVQFIGGTLGMASIKLLHNLSLHISQELADCLCGSAGQLSSLFKLISENIVSTEEQAAAIGIVVDLPEQDIRLTHQILDEGDFEIVVSRIKIITQGETRKSRFVTPYLEGLVRVLSRITFVLSEEPKAVLFCRDYDVAALFTELLQQNGLDKVQITSALALETLSRESKNLTKLPEIRPPGFRVSGFLRLSKKPVMTGLCRVHRGACTQRDTFCLLEGQSLARLVALLDHTNEKVVEASLAALSTLLDDGVYIEGGVSVLCEAEGIKPILDVLVERRTENLWRRAVWMVERLLRTKHIAYKVSGDTNVSTALLDAFQHDDYQTREIAERALKHIDR